MFQENVHNAKGESGEIVTPAGLIMLICELPFSEPVKFVILLLVLIFESIRFDLNAYP